MVDIYFQWDLFLFIILRISSFFLVAPIFGGKNVPSYTKIGLSFMVSLLLLSSFSASTLSYSLDALGYSWLVLQEIFIGILLGFITYLVYSILYLAGQLIDFQIGFTMVSVFDPLSQVQVPITGNFYYFLLSIMILITNGHHTILRSLVYSYQIVPIGGIVVQEMLLHHYISMMGNFFILAFKIASPVIGSIFIINVALGILARTAPQMNMFVVGLPLKLIFGLLTLWLMMPIFASVSDFIIEQLYDDILMVLKGLMP
ncbi:MAG: flagellar type III secretion system protein FliR [Epulopiscium sp.]|nr:flagellar type III secretion system protein FliR [Candidatus Epulonipiscium sp.]